MVKVSIIFHNQSFILISKKKIYSREKDPDVIFIGDCILETLQSTDIWNTSFAPMHCLNFSIRNDGIENLLWRIENGTLDNVNPKVYITHYKYLSWNFWYYTNPICCI